jgi:transcriptional regulator GlxA family with amidase domain
MPDRIVSWLRALAWVAAWWALVAWAGVASPSSPVGDSVTPPSAAPPGSHEASASSAIPPRPLRAGHVRPLVAVVADNAYTELTDYVIPYAVLAESGVADVEALATGEGPIRMFPALRIVARATIADFDARHPEGAGFVIVPAVERSDDPLLLGWVRAQAGKGATIVGICDGAWVLARAGLLAGREATSHWYSLAKLENEYPDTRWRRDARYVADHAVVTTTGVSASIPASLALVESIAGREHAAVVAARLGVTAWDAAHDSDAFGLGAGDLWTAAWGRLARWRRETIGLRVEPGVDALALALEADALARTDRTVVVSLAAGPEPVATRRGLAIVPDLAATDPAANAVDRVLTPRSDLPPAQALDATLADIEQWYGRRTADFVALQLEYPR